MNPARSPRPSGEDARLLWIDPGLSQGRWSDARVSDLATILRLGDLLVLNDAATLPASLFARTEDGRVLEVRLAGEDEESEGDRSWVAVLFGNGDWRMRTEERPSPPRLEPGDVLRFEGDGERRGLRVLGHSSVPRPSSHEREASVPDALSATVTGISPISPRLVSLRFDREGAPLWEALYRVGLPVQYSYASRPLALWDVQTCYASRPWAVEAPSAGLALSWGLLDRLRGKGVRLAWLTHAAGLSSTGEPALDAALPLPERYEIPERTVRVIHETHASGGRVIAGGTTVARALEACAADHGGRLVPGGGRTGLRIEAGFRPRVVDGLLTGLHETDTSHYTIVLSFADRSLADTAHAHAEESGYLGHEFGDLALVLPSHFSGRTRSMRSRGWCSMTQRNSVGLTLRLARRDRGITARTEASSSPSSAHAGTL